MAEKIAIHHPELVAIDGADGKIYFGGKTDWFPSAEQRHLRGGAVVAAELLSYLAATRSSLWDLYPPRERRTQAEFETLMEKVWASLTPEGRERLELDNFMDGLNAYLAHAGHKLVFNVLDIPADREERPSADRCHGFIDDAMDRDTPVAFLSRSRDGDGRVICNWSLIVARQGNLVTIAEDGAMGKTDLRLWYDASALGGAMVFAMLHPL
jgi:hypothetical protein